MTSRERSRVVSLFRGKEPTILPTKAITCASGTGRNYQNIDVRVHSHADSLANRMRYDPRKSAPFVVDGVSNGGVDGVFGDISVSHLSRDEPGLPN